eukprot:COSAG02_NODE_6023_length_3869_cov_1.528382_3_plen_53_part_00
MMNVNGTRLPLVWNGTSALEQHAVVGKEVALRLFFRDAIIYAIGSNSISEVS